MERALRPPARGRARWPLLGGGAAAALAGVLVAWAAANTAPTITGATGLEVRPDRSVAVSLSATDADADPDDAALSEAVRLQAVAPAGAPAWLDDSGWSVPAAPDPTLAFEIAAPETAAPAAYVISAMATDGRGLSSTSQFELRVLAPLCPAPLEVDDDGTCAACPDHHLPNVAKTRCVACPADTERADGTGSCTACPRGELSAGGEACAPNGAPHADAGPDLTAEPRRRVVLDGTGSSDPEGRPLAYAWSQREGPDVALTRGATARPRFPAPRAAAETLLRFRLKVTDPQGRSDTDWVRVTVQPANSPPTAAVVPAQGDGPRREHGPRRRARQRAARRQRAAGGVRLRGRRAHRGRRDRDARRERQLGRGRRSADLLVDRSARRRAVGRHGRRADLHGAGPEGGLHADVHPDGQRRHGGLRGGCGDGLGDGRRRRADGGRRSGRRGEGRRPRGAGRNRQQRPGGRAADARVDADGGPGGGALGCGFRAAFVRRAGRRGGAGLFAGRERRRQRLGGGPRERDGGAGAAGGAVAGLGVDHRGRRLDDGGGEPAGGGAARVRGDGLGVVSRGGAGRQRDAGVRCGRDREHGSGDAVGGGRRRAYREPDRDRRRSAFGRRTGAGARTGRAEGGRRRGGRRAGLRGRGRARPGVGEGRRHRGADAAGGGRRRRRGDLRPVAGPAVGSVVRPGRTENLGHAEGAAGGDALHVHRDRRRRRPGLADVPHRGGLLAPDGVAGNPPAAR